MKTDEVSLRRRRLTFKSVCSRLGPT